MSLLKIDKLNAGYGDLQVLYDISLEVEKGSIVSVLGSNGSGKTTLLRAISGLSITRIMSGTIELKGKRIDGMAPYQIVEEGVAHVPEGRGVFPKMSVQENLEVGAYTDMSEVGETMREMFKIFPILGERRRQLAGTLSGGERQMLVIARGLMSKPEIIMFDEPSLGLMPIIIPRIFEIVRNIHAEGTTVLLIEQDVRKSLELSDYSYILETGRVTLKGESKSLVGNPHIKKAYLGM